MNIYKRIHKERENDGMNVRNSSIFISVSEIKKKTVLNGMQSKGLIQFYLIHKRQGIRRL